MVDVLLLVDRDELILAEAAESLASGSAPAKVEPFGLDVKDRDGIARLATRASELGRLRAVAHAAGVSPTMADWREIVAVDLVGTALLVDACFPLASAGTAVVCFASIAPLLALGEADHAAGRGARRSARRCVPRSHPGGRRPRDRGPGHGLHLGEARCAPAGPARVACASGAPAPASARSRRA